MLYTCFDVLQLALKNDTKLFNEGNKEDNAYDFLPLADHCKEYALPR